VKLCPDDFQCPYQATFDVLWRLEAIDPGYCEYYCSQSDSKCPHPLSKAFQRKVEGEVVAK